MTAFFGVSTIRGKMKISSESLEYLRGDKFADGYTFQTGSRHDHPPVGLGRIDFLCEMASGKRVIHLGCCDHLPIIEKAIANGRWLHGKLAAKSATCVGLDIDEEAVTMLQQKLGIPDVYCCDITKALPSQLDGQNFDAVIAGEVLEHIDNPVAFLSSVRRNLLGRVAEIIISVPNAFYGHNRRHALRGRERINSDHRYWFTPYTLAKVCVMAGLQPEEFFLVEFGATARPSLRRRISHGRFPMLRDGIVIRARL